MCRFTANKGIVMFENLACVFVNPNNFLSYNDKVAGLFSDFRVTANAAIHREEGRKLTDQEIEKLLQAVELMGIEVEERSPTDEEEKLINDIQVYHPEVKYIIKSIRSSKVEARRGRNVRRSYRQKEKKEEQRREEQSQRDRKPRKISDREKKIRKEKVDEQRKLREEKYYKEQDDPDKFGPIKREPEDRQELYDQLKGKEDNEYDGWKGFLLNTFDFLKNPELSKSERLALRRGKKSIIRDLRRNYRAMEKIEKQLEENFGLIDFLDLSLSRGDLNPGTMAAFTELIRRDPELIESLDLPDINEDMEFIERREKLKQTLKDTSNAAIVIDLDKFAKIADIEDMFTENSTELVEYLKDKFDEHRISTEKLEMLIDEEQEKRGKRIVSIVGPLYDVSLLKVEFDLKNKDMHNKDFWDKVKKVS